MSVVDSFAAQVSENALASGSTKKQGRSAVGIGLATLITIMVVVLLTTFSVLALLSARSDLNLSEKAMQSMEDYYAADFQAQTWLAQLDATIRGTWTPATAATLDAAGFYYALANEDDGCVVSEAFPIGTGRQLSVEVLVSKEGQLTIIKWQSGPKNI